MVVKRGIVWVSDDNDHVLVYQVIEIALVRCCGVLDKNGKQGKRHWFRVLPSDILPYKRYSVPAHDAVVACYTKNWWPLRAVADAFAGYRPIYVTVWRWAGGIGAWALGRIPVDAASPFAAVKAVTALKLGCSEELENLWNKPVKVPDKRWRILRRRDECAAAKKVLRVAQHVATVAEATTNLALAFWVSLMFSMNTALRISFWCTSPFTLLKQASGQGSTVGSSNDTKEDTLWTPSRSPPGATSK